MKLSVLLLAFALGSCSALQLPMAAQRPVVSAAARHSVPLMDADVDSSAKPKVKVKVRVRSKAEREAKKEEAAVVEAAAAAPVELDDTETTITVNAPKADFSKPEPKAPTGMGAEGEVLTEDEKLLLEAVQKANCSRILAALQTGVNPNVRDPNGRTPLHFVAGVGLAPAAVLLLHFGAEPNVRDKEDLTPIHMAAGYTNAQTLRVLIAAGADHTLSGKQQGTPLEVVLALGEYQLKQFMERTGTEKLKKKDDKLEELKACMDVLLDVEGIQKDSDWDDMLTDVMKTIAQEEEAAPSDQAVPQPA